MHSDEANPKIFLRGNRLLGEVKRRNQIECKCGFRITVIFMFNIENILHKRCFLNSPSQTFN